MIKVGDLIEILVDGAFSTSEKKGTKLIVTRVSALSFRTTSTNIFGGEWGFNYIALNSGEIRHIPQNPFHSSVGSLAAMSSGWESYTPTGSWENDITKTKPKCECGQSKLAQNKDDDRWDMHSTWCNIYKEGKSNEKSK